MTRLATGRWLLKKEKIITRCSGVYINAVDSISVQFAVTSHSLRGHESTTASVLFTTTDKQAIISVK